MQGTTERVYAGYRHCKKFQVIITIELLTYGSAVENAMIFVMNVSKNICALKCNRDTCLVLRLILLSE